jgi:hypothetical protein
VSYPTSVVHDPVVAPSAAVTETHSRDTSDD